MSLLLAYMQKLFNDYNSYFIWLFLIGRSNDSSCACDGDSDQSDGDSDQSDGNNGVTIALATLLIIAVIGLVISVVINVFFVVQNKQSRCVVTSIRHIIIIVIAI